MDPYIHHAPTDQPLAPDYGPPPPFQTWPAYQPPPTTLRRSRLKTALGGFALAGLLIVGGAATVFAADPTPTPSTSPSTTTPSATDNGSNGSTPTHNCPKD